MKFVARTKQVSDNDVQATLEELGEGLVNVTHSVVAIRLGLLVTVTGYEPEAESTPFTPSGHQKHQKHIRK